MIKIEYPEHHYRIKKEDGKELIFDEFRKKWLRLTPEEWVRQNFLHHLVQIKKYPPALIAIEKEIRLGELRKRCDIVVYKKDKPWMIVECKEMNVKLEEAVIKQILNYNVSLMVQFLVVSNGTNTFAFELNQGVITTLEQLPDFI